MAKIFISYRRADSEYQTDRLHRELKQYVDNPSENIFIDVDNIPYGVDFVEHLEGKVAQCEVLLAVIGKDWLTHTDSDSGKRSLENPADFVRLEIAAALEREIPVVPVLLDGTQVPGAEDLPEDLQRLARRNGKFINRLSFSADVKSLVTGLPIDLPAPSSPNQSEPLPPAEDGGAAKMWGNIDSSLDPDDYDEFKAHFSSSKWAFEAGRRIRQLQSWASIDQNDADTIADFRAHAQDTAQLFQALEVHTQKAMRRAAARALNNQGDVRASKPIEKPQQSESNAKPQSSKPNKNLERIIGAAAILFFLAYLVFWLTSGGIV